jgi:uncharacterized protein YjbI with pentapeptide repeats
MVSPKRAPVKPRVVSRETNETVLLEDVIESYLARKCAGVIELTGRPGAGKTTALAHLASLAFADRIILVDDAWQEDVEMSSTERVVIYATRRRMKRNDICYELAPWSTDDLIEYLLATDPDRCSSVVTRFSDDGDRVLLEGTPALVCLVAEQMAKSDQIQDVRSALRQAIAQEAVDQQTLEDARHYATALILDQQELVESKVREMLGRGAKPHFVGILGSRFVQVLLMADGMISNLKNNPKYLFPAQRLPRDLVNEVARLVRAEPTAFDRLQQLSNSGEIRSMAMVASILHAADRTWRPSNERCLYFPGAYLPNAQWQSITLCRANLRRADLRGADLRAANLERARLDRTNLSRLRGEDALLTVVSAVGANFSHSSLVHAELSYGQFMGARFVGADLQDAVATQASFVNVDFQGASLRNAVCEGCSFQGASLVNVDLRNADLRRADLSEQNLRSTLLTGANLEGSKLHRSDLEFVECPSALLRAANLSDAYLTGSKMVGADLRVAKLNRAALADIDWEQADLRFADLRGCSFHMGSTRSGLVGSPFPCHGTRTGFYTNDFEDKSFKTPELIRKANLCGADLRGAMITDVDFYLVDLRGAIYDAEQEAHFRQCDAILENYTA